MLMLWLIGDTVCDDSPQDRSGWLAGDLYIDAMRALGQRPVLHVGQAR